MAASCQFQGVHRQPLSFGYNRNEALMALLDKHADKFAVAEETPRIDYAAIRRTVAAAKATGALRQLTIEEQAEEFKRLHPTPAAIRGRPRNEAITAAVNELLSMGEPLPFGALSKVARKHGVNWQPVRTRYEKTLKRPANIQKPDQTALARGVELLLKLPRIYYGAYTEIAAKLGCSKVSLRNRYIAETIDRRNAHAA